MTHSTGEIPSREPNEEASWLSSRPFSDGEGVSSELTPEAPWPGLRSYTEEDEAFFVGRDDEIKQVSDMVQGAPSTVLYGKSGFGKTSLLQAGVFPNLRRSDILPVSVHLKYGDGVSIADQMKAKFSEALKRRDKSGRLIVSGTPPSPDQTLWEYFHSKTFALWGPGNRLLKVVFVFDQFEELFTLGQAESNRITEIENEFAALVESVPPERFRRLFESVPSEAADYDLNRRSVAVVLCLREDFLASLDPWRLRLPSLLATRHRLKGLTPQKAAEVVKAGGALVSADIVENIVRLASDPKRQKLNFIDPAAPAVEPVILSLMCDHLNRIRIARGDVTITADLLKFGDTVLEKFYEWTLHDTRPGVREWIEDRLVTPSGYRQQASLDEANAKGIDEADINKLVKRHLLQRELRNNCIQIELTHDRLTDPVMASREARTEAQALVARARQDAEQLRGQLLRPTADEMIDAGTAVERLESSIATIGTTPELCVWQALCLGRTAEVFLEQWLFDEALAYVRRANDLLTRVGPLAGGVEASIGAVARAQASYVAGVVALESGPIALAEPHFVDVIRRADSFVDDVLSPAAARDMVVLNSKARLKQAEIHAARYAYDSSSHVLGIVEERAKNSRQIAPDECAAALTMAYVRRVKGLPAEAAADAQRWLRTAEAEIESRLELDPENVRWCQLRAELLLLRADRAIDESKLRDAIADAEALANLLLSVPATFNHQPWLRWRRIQCGSLSGRLDAESKEWDRAFERLDRASAEAAELSEAFPQSITAEWECTLCLWHHSMSRLKRYETQSKDTRSEDDLIAARVGFESSTRGMRLLLERLPDNFRTRRGVAVCLSQTATTENLAGEEDASRIHYHEAFDLLAGIPAPASSADEVQQVIYINNYHLADLAEKKGDYREAVVFIAAAVAAVEVQANSSPEPFKFLKLLAHLHRWSAGVETKLGSFDRADADLMTAGRMLDRAWDSLAEAKAKIATHPDGEPVMSAPQIEATEAGQELLLLKASYEMIRSTVAAELLHNDRASEPLCNAGDIALRVWTRSRTAEVYEFLEAVSKRAVLLASKLESPADLGPQMPVGHDQVETRAAASLTETSLVDSPDAALRNIVSDASRLRILARRINRAMTLRVDYEVRGNVHVPKRPQNWLLPPIIPGCWRTLSEGEQNDELAKLSGEVATSIPADRVLRIRCLQLDCYADAQLFETEIADRVESLSGKSIVLRLRQRGADTILDGRASTIYTINNTGSLRLRTPAQFTQYLLLFVNAVQGDEGRFLVIQGIEEVEMSLGAPAGLRADVSSSIRPLVVMPDIRGGWTATATVSYRDFLCYARFEVSSAGFVKMLDDEPFASELPIINDLFVDNARTVPLANRFRAARNLAVLGKNWGEGAEATQSWANALFDNEAEPSKSKVADVYHELVLLHLLANDVPAALKAAAQGSERAADESEIMAAKAHVLLYADRLAEAEAIYFQKAEAKSRDSKAVKAWINLIIDDLKRLEDEGRGHNALPQLREKIGRLNPEQGEVES